MKIGIIGFGNLGKSFIKGLIKLGFDHNHIGVTARTQKTLNTINQLYPDIRTFDNKTDLIAFGDAMVLGIKPQNAKEVCDEIKSTSFDNKIIVSFVSGVNISYLANHINDSITEDNIIRAMPNLAISNCEGVIGLSYNFKTKNKLILEFIDIFNALGEVINIADEYLETITVTAACGLAFAGTMMKTYSDSITPLLGDSTTANDMTLQVFKGAISLLKDNDISFDELNNIVATKGGVTEVGLRQFDTDTLRKILSTVLNLSHDQISKIQNSNNG